MAGRRVQPPSANRLWDLHTRCSLIDPNWQEFREGPYLHRTTFKTSHSPHGQPVIRDLHSRLTS